MISASRSAAGASRRMASDLSLRSSHRTHAAWRGSTSALILREVVVAMTSVPVHRVVFLKGDQGPPFD
ncbi:hypothetical protein D3C71_2213930 [compost metagenome]